MVWFFGYAAEWKRATRIRYGTLGSLMSSNGTLDTADGEAGSKAG
jgi:hypothetical protein